MQRLMQMVSAESMMDMAVLAGSQHAFETGLENYAQAAWDKIIRVPYERGSDWMARFKEERDVVFSELYKFVFND